MVDGSISKQGDIFVKLDDGSVINLAEVLLAIQAASETDRIDDHLLSNVLMKLNVDTVGRLRVSAESAVIASGTVTTAATVGSTAIGPILALPWAQMESNKQFQGGFARNLVRT
jgi:hypothetical protein